MTLVEPHVACSSAQAWAACKLRSLLILRPGTASGGVHAPHVFARAIAPRSSPSTSCAARRAASAAEQASVLLPRASLALEAESGSSQSACLASLEAAPSAGRGRVRACARTRDGDAESNSPSACPARGTSPDQGAPPTKGQVMIKRRRPRAYWGKPYKFSEEARERRAEAVRRRWQDPAFRSRVLPLLQGHKGKNKGRSFSPEVRAMMRQKKLLALQHPGLAPKKAPKTRRRQTGFTHTQEFKQYMSSIMAGKPKSAHHRTAISATLSKRYEDVRRLRGRDAALQPSLASSPGPEASAASLPEPQDTSLRAGTDADSATLLSPTGPATTPGQASSSATSPGHPASAGPSCATDGSSGGATLPVESSRFAASPNGDAEAGSAAPGEPRYSGGTAASPYHSQAAGQPQWGVAPPVWGAASPADLMEFVRGGGPRPGRTPGSRPSDLASYLGDLEQYKVLKKELTPWMEDFAGKHNRQPQLWDVECTGLPWLIERYKRYIILRQKVMADAAGLRDKLTGPEGPKRKMGRPAREAAGGSPSGGQGADRMLRALQYQKEKTPKGVSPDQPGGVSTAAEQPKEPLGVPVNAPPRVAAALLKAKEYKEQKNQAATSATVPAAVPDASAAVRPRPQVQVEILRSQTPPRSRTDPIPSKFGNPDEHAASAASNFGNPAGPASSAPSEDAGGWSSLLDSLSGGREPPRSAPLTSKYRNGPAGIAEPLWHPQGPGAPDQDAGFGFEAPCITQAAPDSARAIRLAALKRELATRLKAGPESRASLLEA